MQTLRQEAEGLEDFSFSSSKFEPALEYNYGWKLGVEVLSFWGFFPYLQSLIKRPDTWRNSYSQKITSSVNFQILSYSDMKNFRLKIGVAELILLNL
ncbi:hypothetical protein AVEN_134569-1 [Araneus ventricosus]|uniref:Uncharacterized protein n=1 Tax=Araneus ventricosus TaxID=182803 RepID=A0A4Y2QQJ6_ARAVE|nr:hypothetical protein AVEN_134569-1 [Araneus ventricosus]